MSKPEVFFFGNIIGANGATDGDGIFVEAIFEAGKNWENMSGNKILQTQTSYSNEHDFFCFAHPFEVKFRTNNYFGWPKIVLKIWKLDQTNVIDFLSYGTMYMPNKPGYYELNINTWCIHGKEEDEKETFFMDSKPILPNHAPVSYDLDYRVGMVTKPGPTIYLGVNVLFKDFNTINKRNMANKD